jgi:hypothetical protein
VTFLLLELFLLNSSTESSHQHYLCSTTCHQGVLFCLAAL